MMDRKSRELATWGKNKSTRLQGFDYSTHYPYHVIIRTDSNKKPFHENHLAMMVCDSLQKVVVDVNAYLASYCLMPDHLHLLLSPDVSGLTIGEIIGKFKGITTNFSWKLGWSGRLWQKRFYDHVLRKNEAIEKVARYIYENPERKGLSKNYPYRWFDEHL